MNTKEKDELREELMEKINLWKRISKPPEKKQKGWGGFSLSFLQETEKEAIRSQYLLKAIDHMEGNCSGCENHFKDSKDCPICKVYEHPQPLDAVKLLEKKLNPQYMNTVFTWAQIKMALEENKI